MAPEVLSLYRTDTAATDGLVWDQWLVLFVFAGPGVEAHLGDDGNCLRPVLRPFSACGLPVGWNRLVVLSVGTAHSG